ncbi:hypothetical protein EUGRSUZ_B03548 [Eucalyptus grandis]|uniref:Uncharacterized protein n=2 Tax=Eucalyptus grandis TaxID=71139 RepID=A0ACC3LWU9_EUCGR|nr:hypothetical protein EUGRSUZ_B03548 [Eucalyptus grandis]
MEQLANTGAVEVEVEADEMNLPATEPSSSFIDANPLKRKPSWSFIDLDDKAAASATTAYDELFADPAWGDSFWRFGDDLNDSGMGLSITLLPEDCKKLEDVPEPGAEPINPFSMFK